MNLKKAGGFSLIELMVSMVIGLIAVLVVTMVLGRSEGAKRRTTSINDVNANGAFVGFTLDRVLRSAGSGYSQAWSQSYGCQLDAQQGAANKVLPRPFAYSAASAFANVPLSLRLAPVLIGKGMADTASEVRGDVLVVMGGASGTDEYPQPVVPSSVTSTNLQLPNSLGYASGDLALLVDSSLSSCLVEQVTFAGSATGSTNPNLPLSGTWYSATGTNVNLSNFGTTTLAVNLGNPLNNPPMMQMFAVGANSSLSSLNLLQLPVAANNDITLADGVVEMRAIYGLDTTNPPNGVIDSWMDPVTGSGYEYSMLADGTSAARNKLRRIVAVRVGFFMRASLPEKASEYQQPAGTALSLFTDLDASVLQTRTLTGAELNYRWRVLEISVPLRNVLLAPQS